MIESTNSPGEEEEAFEELRDELLLDEEEEEEEDMPIVCDPDLNLAHCYVEYKSGLNLGILKEFMEGMERTLDECIDKLNDYVVHVMDSPTNQVSFQVLTEVADRGIVWKTTPKNLLEGMIQGFTCKVERINPKTKKPEEKVVSVAQEYFKSLDRNWVKYMTYNPSMPGGISGNEMLNTFTGFPFHNKYNPGPFWVHHEQAQKVIEVIVTHLRDVLCRGNKKIYFEVKKWMRMVRQHPEFRPEVVLVFIGEEGIGKSMFFKYYAKVFGKNAVYLAEPKSFLAKFTGDQLDDRVLVCCDEADFNDRELGPKLKNMVTAEERKMEKKGINAKQIRNYLNGIFTTNKRDCLPVSNTNRNRRYFPITVSDKYKDDKSYFDKLEEALDNPLGLAIFDFWLRCKKVAPEKMSVPVTQELNNMKMSALSNLQNWWLQVLDDGRHVSKNSLTNPEVDGEWVLFPVDMGTICSMFNMTQSHKKLARGEFVAKMKPILPPETTFITHSNLKECRIPTLSQCREYAHCKLGIETKGEFIGEKEKNERKRKKWSIPDYFSPSSKRASCSR